MSDCYKINLGNACWTKADASKESVFVHHTYGKNAGGGEILKNTRYTSVDGTVLNIPLTDSITVGNCDECQKKIFATHDRYYQVNAVNIPSTHVGYDFDFPVVFGTINVNDTYFHTFCTPANCYTYPPATANPTTPVLIGGNVAAINNFISSVLILDGFIGNEVILVQNTDLSLTAYLDPSYTLGNSFYLGTSTPDNYIKGDPTIPTTHTVSTETTCIVVQEIKEKNNCTGEETYRFVVENGNGLLVEASSLIPNFDETLLSSSICSSSSINAEEALPHTLVCIKGGGVSVPPTWIGLEFDYASIFTACSIGSNIADYYFVDFQSCGSTIPSPPINVLDQVAVQLFIDTALIPDLVLCYGPGSIAIGDIIYTVNGTTIVVWYNPTYPPTNNNWVFGDASGAGCEKQSPAIPTLLSPPVAGIIAQVVKYKLADGTIVDKFYTVGANPVEIVVDNTMEVIPGNCKVENLVIEKILSPIDSYGSPVGTLVREVRTYSDNILKSTVYYDTVTNAVVSLPAGTSQLGEAIGLDKEVIVMCDDNGNYLKHFVYGYGAQIIQTLNTDILGSLYTPVGTERVCGSTYNNNITYTPTSVFTLAANTYHSVSIAILSGSATINVNGVSFVAPVGYSNSWEASTTLSNSITVTPTSPTDLIVINTIS